MHHKLYMTLAICSMSLALLASGCGEDHDDDHGTESNGHGHSTESNGHTDSNSHADSNGASHMITGSAALHACGQIAHTGTALTASDSIEAAAMADDVFMPGSDPYTIMLPESGTGYLSLMISEPHQDWVVFSKGADEIVKWTYDGSETDLTSKPNGECPSDVAGGVEIHMHENLNAVLELKGSGEVWLLMMNPGTSTHGEGNHGESNGG